MSSASEDLWTRNSVYKGGWGVCKSGTHADLEWNALACHRTLPVELDGRSVTAHSHWDEECFIHELMTGNLSGEHQPLSRITVASLQDMGYNVDYDNQHVDLFTKAYDLGDCGWSCPNARRLGKPHDQKTNDKDVPYKRRTPPPRTTIKKFSEASYRSILQHAKGEFESRRRRRRHVLETTDTDPPLPEGVEDVGATSWSLDVIFEEQDGSIHAVSVTAKDVEGL